jgi:hypothetical protein
VFKGHKDIHVAGAEGLRVLGTVKIEGTGKTEQGKICKALSLQPYTLYLTTHQIFVLVLIGLGFELRALHLQSRHSTASTTPLVHFAVVTLEMGSQTICPG